MNSNPFLVLTMLSSQMISLKIREISENTLKKSLEKQPSSLLPRRKVAGKVLNGLEKG